MYEAAEFLNDGGYNECNKFKRDMIQQIDSQFNIENQNFNSESALLLYNQIKDKITQAQLEKMGQLNVQNNFKRKMLAIKDDSDSNFNCNDKSNITKT